MSRATYFWQAGSLPGIGAFPAGVVVTVADDGRTVLGMAPLATPPQDGAPPPLAVDNAAIPLPSSSSREDAAPAAAPPFPANGG